MADCVGIMDSGRIVASGPVETLKATAVAASLEEVFFDCVNRRLE
jgi:ABC-type Na+ transport system ATPase subunit NatA